MTLESAERDEFKSPAKVEALLLEISRTKVEKNSSQSDPANLKKQIENTRDFNRVRRFNRGKVG